MMYPEKTPDKRGSRRAVGLAVGGLLLVLFLAGGAYWQYLSYVPAYPAPVVTLPVPNGHDDLRAAAAVLRQTSRLTPNYRQPMTLAELKALAADSRPALARLRQGLEHEYLTPPITSFSATFPELAQAREFARRLVAEGDLAEREGRYADAAQSYLDCLRLGAQVPRGGPVIHGLVGVAITTIGLGPMSEVADRLDAGTAARVAREMERLERSASGLPDTLTVEKEGTTQALAALLRQRGSPWSALATLTGGAPGAAPGGTGIQPGQFGIMLRYVLTPKGRVIEDYRSYMDRVIGGARQPYYNAGATPSPPGDPLNQALAPVYSGVPLRWSVIQARWRVTQTRLALRASQLRSGAPPPTLGALMPEYLASIPQDPFAPHPLLYRVRNGKALVYSRGPDGDDDGGTEAGTNPQATTNGDLVEGGRARRGSGRK